MATYHTDEEGMAEFIFNGWVESEGHYENMIRPEYAEIGLGSIMTAKFYTQPSYLVHNDKIYKSQPSLEVRLRVLVYGMSLPAA